ncbi:unnamed protein product [Blepharisma stoltei]|uniref:Uncharacterized protein n=1 Tax=Blepharisma stoltei TaxID=1481888 RepID=A0AAU9I960_9CILI|nr:unnamed protein product [Blepharisma stoltei]
MIIWLVLLSLIFLDLFYTLRYLKPYKNQENIAYAWFLLFFLNYIPLVLFEAYQTEISLYLKSLGFEFVDNANTVSFLRSLWSWFINFLQWSSLFYRYSFWTSGFISLAIIYDCSHDLWAYFSCLIGMTNPFFFLLSNVSVSNNDEYFILYGINIGIFILTFLKLNYSSIRTKGTSRIMDKYLYLIIVTTMFALKRIFFYDIDIFDISYYLFVFYFSFGLLYLLMAYYSISYGTTLFYFSILWARLQENRQRHFNIGENAWKIFSAYALIAFFTYSMFLTYKLVENLWGEFWSLKEIMFIIAAGGIGYVLVYPKDENNDNLTQGLSNSISIYCQICVLRGIFSLVN